MIKTKKGNPLVYIVLFNTENEFNADNIKKITGQPYSHASISLDTSMNNMYSFSNIPYVKSGLLATGNGFVRESIYSPTYINNAFFDVYAMEVTNKKYKDIEKVIDFMINKGPVTYKYNTLGLLEYFFHRVRILKSDSPEFKKKISFFCSEFVAFLINEGKNINLSPGDLAELDKVKWAGRYTIDRFDENKLIKDINEMKDIVFENYIDDTIDYTSMVFN